jgi:hypothetical protein
MGTTVLVKPAASIFRRVTSEKRAETRALSEPIGIFMGCSVDAKVEK